MGRNLATDMAPPFVLVAHFFIAGAIFYAISMFLLPFFTSSIDGYFISSDIASLMHLYLLGFVMMVIFGAMYQLVPVVLEIPIFSKDFAYVQFYIFVSGLLLFALGLWKYTAIMPYGALMMYLSMLIFVSNIFLTYKNIKKWEIVAKFIFMANIFLFIGVSIGFLLALNLIYGFYPDFIGLVQMHVSSAIFGFIILTIMGVGMVLLPMFSLSHGFKTGAINIAFYSGTYGLLIYLFSKFFVSKISGADILTYLGLIFISISVFCALYQMWLVFSTRVRKQNDFWAKNMIASFFSIILSMVLIAIGIINNDEKYFMLFGYILFFGFFTFFIMGHVYKILPFLVWFQRYSPMVGKMKVPMLNDMVKEKIADWQFWFTLIGLILSSIAIVLSNKVLFQVGAIIMAIGTLLVIYNIYFILTYGIKELKEIK